MEEEGEKDTDTEEERDGLTEGLSEKEALGENAAVSEAGCGEREGDTELEVEKEKWLLGL